MWWCGSFYCYWWWWVVGVFDCGFGLRSNHGFGLRTGCVCVCGWDWRLRLCLWSGSTTTFVFVVGIKLCLCWWSGSSCRRRWVCVCGLYIWLRFVVGLGWSSNHYCGFRSFVVIFNLVVVMVLSWVAEGWREGEDREIQMKRENNKYYLRLTLFVLYFILRCSKILSCF